MLEDFATVWRLVKAHVIEYGEERISDKRQSDTQLAISYENEKRSVSMRKGRYAKQQREKRKADGKAANSETEP